MKFRSLLMLLASSPLTGCAYTSVIPISPQDTVTQGQRVYDSKPILVVTGSSAQIQFIPNYSRAYAVQFGAFLSKNEYSITVDNGIIKTLDSKLDTTAIVDLLKTIADKALSAAAAGAKTTGGDPVLGGGVAIFDFVFDDQGNIVELKPIKVDRPPAIRRLQAQAGAPPAPTPSVPGIGGAIPAPGAKKPTPRV